MLQYLIYIMEHSTYYLTEMVSQYGFWAYAIMGLVLFCETGIVLMPFLPGDTLLFTAGSLSAGGINILNIKVLLVVFTVSVILGDSTNFWIGRRSESQIRILTGRWYFNEKHLSKTIDYYHKYGLIIIIFGRFILIIRTFIPFAAGISKLEYLRFLSFSVIGSISWVCLISLCGYFFGRIPIVKSHFSLIILMIIAISIFPVFIQFIKKRLIP